MGTKTAVKTKHRIHLIRGDKGGVGKSFVARTFIQHYLDHDYPFIPIEADRYNPDVANRYQQVDFQFAIFSDDWQQTRADDIVEFAKQRSVIISLPSQVGRPLGSWLEDALDTAQRYGIQFVYWFISSGSYESLDLFKQELTRHGQHIPFVLVCNHGVGDEWDIEEVDGLPQLMQSLSVPMIQFPALPKGERNRLDKHNLTLGDARTSTVFQAMSISRDRIEKFLRKAGTAIESTGLVP